MWRSNIVEENDIMGQLGPKLHSKLGRTVGIIFWLFKPLFFSWKYVVMEIGFCVANGSFSLAAKEVCSRALIKKRQYWAKRFPGYILDRNFSYK